MGQTGVHLGHADGRAAAAAVRPRRGAHPRLGTPNLEARCHVQQGESYKIKLFMISNSIILIKFLDI